MGSGLGDVCGVVQVLVLGINRGREGSPSSPSPFTASQILGLEG